jgi:hypothetical protein
MTFLQHDYVNLFPLGLVLGSNPQILNKLLRIHKN